MKLPLPHRSLLGIRHIRERLPDVPTIQNHPSRTQADI
ncbi:hypothetical protein CBM2637_B110408 [Cupriavidus taiwanensis]|nr:hypothetical protein CBM2637_B110408 [Cupriavidus taiwanensis]